MQFAYIAIQKTIKKICSGKYCRLTAEWRIHLPSPTLLTIAHPYSQCRCLDYYAHNKQCTLSAHIFTPYPRQVGELTVSLFHIWHSAAELRNDGEMLGDGGRALSSMTGTTRAATEMAVDLQGWAKELAQGTMFPATHGQIKTSICWCWTSH